MKPFRLPLTLLTLVLSAAALAQPVPPPPPPERGPLPTPAAPQLAADSYILSDFHTGTVLVEKDPDARVAPASITKMMTSYVVFHELAQGNIALEDEVPVSETAWRTGGSRMFIDPSMQVSVEDLIKGIVVQSGNDASVALAEFVAGSEEAFAGLMNHYAEQLGMTNTNFVNSTGLPHENHYTTARDIAVLSAALIHHYPQYYDWYSLREFTFNDIQQHNRNTLLWRDPTVDGLKTGHTEEAGYCLAASALRDGQRLISVVLGSASESSRASETQTLLNYGFRFFETIRVYEAGTTLAEAEVWKGEVDNVSLGLAEDLLMTIPRDRYEDLEAIIDLEPELTAPLAPGEPVGQVRVVLDDETIATRDLVALSEVPEAGFFGRTVDGISLWIGGLFGDDE